jgi:hypothetical protein
VRRFFSDGEHGSTRIPCNAALTLAVRGACEEALDAMLETVLHTFTFLGRRELTNSPRFAGSRGPLRSEGPW